MNTGELRQKYLKFFKLKNHSVIPSASLLPENDPTVLFTTAGMHPLVLYLLGEKHPSGTRLADVQKCVRTGDIDDVGDQWHLTFFEMLGNWSLNDYWKKEAIEFSFEFLTKELNIPVEKLAVSVFEGDDDAPFDEESYNIWKNLGLSEERIYKYNKKENWWGPAGTTGPCGPDSEMFFITDKPACGSDCQPSCSCGKYVEIWNDVFMEYFKDEKGNYNKAEIRNVDTGMGVERVTAVLNNLSDNYQVDTMKPIVEKVEELSDKKYGENNEITNSIRIVADHMRATTMIMGDERGITPGNVDQGYVVRKLIRRAIRHGKKLGIEDNFCLKIAEVVMSIFAEIYPEVIKNKDTVLHEIEKEEIKFRDTLEQGIKEFEKLLNGFKMAEEKTGNKITEISGKQAFKLYDTYGFPIELTEDLAKENDLIVDIQGFEEAFEKHQDLSRAGAEQKFKGGLADTGEMSTKYHTATHLLHSALYKVLGKHVEQKGSNITADRLRFDFTHGEKMTDEEKKQVEDLVNNAIDKKLSVSMEEMSVEEAKKQGAIGLFGDKYGEKVKVYTISPLAGSGSPFSREICGGPHVENIGDLGHFRIKKEESSSAGVRRIKAILE
ncbi:MAG: alanine--tRNA ligase [Candidatus Magasanikbacteria bacterium]